jgi:hypothetical protein
VGLPQYLVPCVQGLRQLAEQGPLFGLRELARLTAGEQLGQGESIDGLMCAEQLSAFIQKVAIARKYMGMFQSLAQQHLLLEGIHKGAVAEQCRFYQ